MDAADEDERPAGVRLIYERTVGLSAQG